MKYEIYLDNINNLQILTYKEHGLIHNMARSIKGKSPVPGIEFQEI